MKQIIIYQEGTAPIVVMDDDDKPLEEYSREISSLLESNNISILHTSTCSTILRPNKISSISVSDSNAPGIENITGKQEAKKEEKEEIQEDIISD
jgi:hypothetical protein